VNNRIKVSVAFGSPLLRMASTEFLAAELIRSDFVLLAPLPTLMTRFPDTRFGETPV